MWNNLVKSGKEIILIIFIILLISCIPVLFQTQDFIYFLQSFGSGVYYLFQSQKIIIPVGDGEELTFFAAVSTPYFNSIIIILGALALSMIVSVLFAYIFHIIADPFKKTIRGALFILESMPDVLIVLLSIQFFIWIHKRTGLVIDIYEYGDKTIYFMPILALSSIPTLFLFKYMITSIDDEKNRDYYLFSQAKGLAEGYIFFNHLFRNILLTLIEYYKNIFLYMISSLLILEIILMLNGIMSFVKVYGIGDFRILMWVLIMIYFPLYLLVRIGEFIVNKWTAGEVA